MYVYNILFELPFIYSLCMFRTVQQTVLGNDNYVNLGEIGVYGCNPGNVKKQQQQEP